MQVIQRFSEKRTRKNLIHEQKHMLSVYIVYVKYFFYILIQMYFVCSYISVWIDTGPSFKNCKEWAMQWSTKCELSFCSKVFFVLFHFSYLFSMNTFYFHWEMVQMNSTILGPDLCSNTVKESHYIMIQDFNREFLPVIFRMLKSIDNIKPSFIFNVQD